MSNIGITFILIWRADAAMTRRNRPTIFRDILNEEVYLKKNVQKENEKKKMNSERFKVGLE